ncbi:MAG TPA: hypothetical protein VJ576_16520 [Rhodocyclaceae bacterium]|nr:hypothetical protein [Rhodocyclaceae bacterium]
MLLDVKRVWVIQQRSSGLFLTPDLFLSRSLKQAGRCEDRESALDTGRINLEDDFEVASFFEEVGEG